MPLGSDYVVISDLYEFVPGLKLHHPEVPCDFQEDVSLSLEIPILDIFVKMEKNVATEFFVSCFAGH